MSEKPTEFDTQILLFKKYNLLKNIGGGAFGTIFLGENVFTKENVAIKIEERKTQKSSLEREAYILYTLKGPGLPEVISFGRTKRYNILIETLLGRSLYQIYNDYDKKFTLKDVCMLAIQMLERLEYIHSKNYIHRDIKPHNFLVSLKNESQIYLIDFGLAKKYKSERGNHVKFAMTKHITGTPRFCSINAMRGVEQSRRDDLESLSYLILYFLIGSLPWQGLKITSRPQRFKEITRLKKNLKVESLSEKIPQEIILFHKYTRKLGFTENPKYEYMKKLFHSVLNKYGYINDKKFSWIEKINDNNNNNDIEIIKNIKMRKSSPHKRLIEKLRNSLVEKQRAKSKEKDNNNDYTLNTIFMDNKNSISDISELQKQNQLGKKVMIQSNDNELLVKNNIIQLNIQNIKHSYNYPLVVYKNDISKENSNNNFNKIAKTFQSNDSNILAPKEINIPDKISMINATRSNLMNIQFSENQEPLLPLDEKGENKNLSKGIKIHDYIRLEEKEGGVIDKDFDYRENEYFKINKPLFPSDQSEYETEAIKNKLRSSLQNNNNNINDNNAILKSKTYVSQQNQRRSLRNNVINNNNNQNIIIQNINNSNNKETKIIKVNNNIIIPPNNGKQINKIIKFPSPKNYKSKFTSFVVKKVSINLNKNSKTNNISPKNISPKMHNNYIQNSTTNNQIKYVNVNQQKNQPKINYNKNLNLNPNLININNSYESNLNLRNSNINSHNNNYSLKNNFILSQDKSNINYRKIFPKMKLSKINEENNNDNIRLSTNRIFLNRKGLNLNLNSNPKAQLNSVNNGRGNLNKIKNNYNNNAFHMINNNSYINKENKQNKSYQIQNNFKKMELNQNRPINFNLNNIQKNNPNFKNNNNKFILNNINNNNQMPKKINLRNSIQTSKTINISPYGEYIHFAQRRENNILTSPK